MICRLVCPDRTEHVAARSAFAAATARMDDAERTVAFLAEGHCPACPHMHLTDETHVRYERAYVWGRCECCSALWELNADTYALHERGRLLDADGS